MKRLLAPLVVVILGTALFGLMMYRGNTDEEGTGRQQFVQFDNRLYDALLRIKPAIEEDEILFLVMDDKTITTLDMYPLSRDITAEGLILLKEFGPEWTMLDIEFVDRSPQGIDLDFLYDDIPEELNASFDFLLENYNQLITNILNGAIDRVSALDYMDQLTQMGRDDSSRLYDYISSVALDRDALLGKAIDYHDRVSATLNIVKEPSSSLTEDERTFAANNFAVTEKLVFHADPFPSDKDILPSIPEVIEPAAWAGFPKMHVDKDGVRRRIDVIYRSESDGEYYTHLGFGTWWLQQGDGTLAGAPAIDVYSSYMQVGDITIPLDESGAMLINFPKREFDGTPLRKKEAAEWSDEQATHLLSFLKLWRHDVLWDDVSRLIDYLEYLGYDAQYYGHAAQPLSSFEADLDGIFNLMFETGDGSGAEDYGYYRDQYLEVVADYLNGPALNELLYSLEDALSDPALDDETAALFMGDLEELPYLFEELSWRIEELIQIRGELREQIAGKTVVVGYIGSSTTDIGATPFQSEYMNVGIYGAALNTLRQGGFLAVSPWWMTIAIIFGSGILLALLGLVATKKSALNTLIGLVVMLVIWAGGALVFLYADFYIHMLPLLLVTLLTLMATQVSNYVIASRDRIRIQSAFSQVISPDLVRQLQDNPELLERRGDNREITAMFTDIEAFSTISEHLNSPDRIIDLLERYLTPMSDIILEEGGTIDKYEGDAIIAFWNAPIEREDHVHRACRAAMRMVEKEAEIHRELVQEGIWDDELVGKLQARAKSSDIHKPHDRLYTRIGINTGINNVGFIGTAPRDGSEGRKDYTALGDGMNLAARLEGVNKQYGTQVLISGSTEEVIHNHFITRRLDRIRVIGKEDVIPLYELSYFKKFPEHYYPEEHDEYRDYYAGLNQTPYHNTFSSDERQCFNFYRDAQDRFQNKDWKGALELFNKILESMPDDGPTRTFKARCEGYLKKAPPKSWDGVYKMEFK